jgi:hypothetical protein
MKRTLMGFAALLMVFSAVTQAEHREFVSTGDVIAVAANEGTLKLREVAEPPADAQPGWMQSGVERSFVVNADTKLMSQERSIPLADIRVGDRVTIHYVIDSGKNVVKSMTVTSRATE